MTLKWTPFDVAAPPDNSHIIWRDEGDHDTVGIGYYCSEDQVMWIDGKSEWILVSELNKLEVNSVEAK